MGEVSMSLSQQFKTSRSGRVLVPRLKTWTGERIVLGKSGMVGITNGNPDCTSTFVSERTLFKMKNSISMSQTLSICNATCNTAQVDRAKVSRSLSYSPSFAGQQRKRARRVIRGVVPPSGGKEQGPMKPSQPTPSPKKRDLRSSTKSQESPIPIKPRKPSRSRSPVKTRTPSPVKSPLREPLRRQPQRHQDRSRSNGRAQSPVESLRRSRRTESRSPVKLPEPPRGRKPAKSNPLPAQDDSPLSSQEPPAEQQSSPRRSPRKSTSRYRSVDIFGPEFQPIVLIKRLEIRESPKRKTSPVKLQSQPKRNPPVRRDRKRENSAPSRERSKAQSATKPRRKKGSKPLETEEKLAPAQSVEEDKTKEREDSSFDNPVTPYVGRRPRTVRDVQKMLRAVHGRRDTSLVEDEAAATADFFRGSGSLAALAVGTLHDCYAESDDNLSIRTIERESSPMSSAVSPIGSLHGDSDVDADDVDDGLLGGSPSLKDCTSFQKAKLVHRTIKERAKLQRIQNRKKKIEEEQRDLPAASTTPLVSQVLQPRRMRALEKDLKEKVDHGLRSFDFDAYYNGNLLHVAVNCDSDTDESSKDSFEDL